MDSKFEESSVRQASGYVLPAVFSGRQCMRHGLGQSVWCRKSLKGVSTSTQSISLDDNLKDQIVPDFRMHLKEEWSTRCDSCGPSAQTTCSSSILCTDDPLSSKVVKH